MYDQSVVREFRNIDTVFLLKLKDYVQKEFGLDVLSNIKGKILY